MAESTEPFKPLDESRAREALKHYVTNYLEGIVEVSDPRVWFNPQDNLYRIVMGSKVHHLTINGLMQLHTQTMKCLGEHALASLSSAFNTGEQKCVLCKKRLSTCTCVMETLHKKVLDMVGSGEEMSRQRLDEIGQLSGSFIHQHNLAVTIDCSLAKFLRAYSDFLHGACEKWELLSALAELEV